MKKVLCLLLVLVMGLSLCACTDNSAEIMGELNGVSHTGWTYDLYASDVNQHCHMTFVFSENSVESYWINDEAPDKNSTQYGTYQIKGKEIIIKYDDGTTRSLAYSYQNQVLDLSDGSNSLTKSWTMDFETGTLTISHMPDNKIPDYAFGAPAPWYYYRYSIKTIKIEEGIESIGRLAFLACEEAVTVELPDSLRKIGEKAFANCRSLETIIIPAHVEYIDDQAFSGCDSLKIY